MIGSVRYAQDIAKAQRQRETCLARKTAPKRDDALYPDDFWCKPAYHPKKIKLVRSVVLRDGILQKKEKCKKFDKRGEKSKVRRCPSIEQLVTIIVYRRKEV